MIWLCLYLYVLGVVVSGLALHGIFKDTDDPLSGPALLILGILWPASVPFMALVGVGVLFVSSRRRRVS